MGVMTCHTSNCTNIMCNDYITEYGYMCTDCQDRLIKFLINKSLTETIYWDSRTQIMNLLLEFKEIPIPQETDLTEGFIIARLYDLQILN